MNEINDDIKYHYCININDFNIPQELNINISKFNKDVSMKFIIFYYFLSSSILLY